MLPACACPAGELRYQELVASDLGWPPALLAKGPGVSFLAGSPLVATGPEVPGYQRQFGSGLPFQPGFNCPGSLK